jgi:hypothetical protein
MRKIFEEDVLLLFVMQDLFIVIVGGSTRVVVPMDRPRS